MRYRRSAQLHTGTAVRSLKTVVHAHCDTSSSEPPGPPGGFVRFGAGMKHFAWCTVKNPTQVAMAWLSMPLSAASWGVSN